jgi:hypothetical protein
VERLEKTEGQPLKESPFSRRSVSLFWKSGKEKSRNAAVEKKKLNCGWAVGLTGFKRLSTWKPWKAAFYALKRLFPI